MKAVLSDRQLAIAAGVLYLVNLMLLPGLAFLLLVVLMISCRAKASELARNHLAQALGMSIVAGLLIGTALLLWFASGMDAAYTLMVVVLYFTLVHSALILLGVIALSKALNGQHYRYPVVGRWFTA